MEGAQAVFFGAILGLLGALPPAVLFERALRRARTPSIAAGLVSIAVSFVILAGALFLAKSLLHADALLFGCAEVTAFLLVWAIEAIRAWYDAQHRVRQGERKSGESSR